jgi:hypothetical protein
MWGKSEPYVDYLQIMSFLVHRFFVIMNNCNRFIPPVILCLPKGWPNFCTLLLLIEGIPEPELISTLAAQCTYLHNFQMLIFYYGIVFRTEV